MFFVEQRVAIETEEDVGIMVAGRRRGYRRGYPVAVLLGLEETCAVLWHVFSEVVKPSATLRLLGRRSEEASLYGFHEAVVNALRPMLKEGVRSIVIVAPSRTDYSREFLDHVRKHHAWLVHGKGSEAAAFGELVGSASTLSDVATLVKTAEFRRLIGETTSGEADHIMSTLEKRLNDISSNAVVLFSLKEIEELLYSPFDENHPRPEYLMLTDRYLTDSKEKSRIQRLLQISQNKKVKTRVINAETPAGKRLSQLGGLVCFTEPSGR